MGIEPVRLGIVSTASINRLVIPPAKASPLIEPIAVASRNEKRANDYAREWNLERAYGSYDALLADPDVEAVYISLPNHEHVPWTLRVLEAGKHVLCEKPLTRHPCEIETVWSLAEARNLQVAEAFMWRHNPQTKRFAELVSEGAVGELQFVRSLFSYAMSDPATDVRMKREWEGGSLMDIGTYCVSGVRLLAGEPVSVYGEQVSGGDGVDVRFSGLMSFDKGVRGLVYSSFETPSRKELEAIGSEGVLRLHDPWHAWRGGIELQREEEKGSERIEVETGDSYRFELEDFARAIRGESEPLLGYADALGQARALAALYLSAEEGRPVELAELDREV
ncbi:MAG: Gfo/Idh/MocA family oxidoreductase [Gaiellaceae bacterium]|jgi:predicted dehydrogenase